MSASVKKTSRLGVGQFTWKRRDGGDKAECWDLVQPKGADLTFFCLKNYGGRPTGQNAFSGWRLVSGGPFTDAGGWTSRQQAMADVAPYLIAYYKNEARVKMKAAKRQLAMVNKFIRGLKS